MVPGKHFLFAMFAEPSHFLAPFLEDATFHYTPGMLTAPFLVGLAWYTFFLLRREMSKAEAKSSSDLSGTRKVSAGLC